jgi:hypothetical protein
VPFYPVLPIVFIATSAAMLMSSLSYVTAAGNAGLLASAWVFLTGLIALVVAICMERSAR